MGDLKQVDKTWGYEVWLENNELYCGKILHCFKDKWSSQGKYHYHKIKDETFYVLKGKVILDINGWHHYLNKGDKIRIQPNTKHRFISKVKESEILEISTHHEDSDSYYE
jgi:mannose-6-phosphate isomerase-like protein (cupin superfamily)